MHTFASDVFMYLWIVTGCDLARLSGLSRWLIPLRHLLRLFFNMFACSIWLNSRSPRSRTPERKGESALRFKGPRHIQRASTSEYWHANDVHLRQQKPQRSNCMQPQWPLARALTLLRPDMCRLFHSHTMRRSLVESGHSPCLGFPFSLSVRVPYFTRSLVTSRAGASLGVFCQPLFLKKCHAGSSTQQHLRHSEGGGQRSNHLGGDNPWLLEADAGDADLSWPRLAPRWSLDQGQKDLKALDLTKELNRDLFVYLIKQRFYYSARWRF